MIENSKWYYCYQGLINIIVKAKNKREARRKAKEKLRKMYFRKFTKIKVLEIGKEYYSYDYLPTKIIKYLEKNYSELYLWKQKYGYKLKEVRS